jgi:hypothetical protein
LLGSWTPRFLSQLLPIRRATGDSFRLTFLHDASGIRLISRVRRGKPAPPGDRGRPLSRDRIFIEVRSRQGRTLYRRALRDPIPQFAEVFEPDGRIRGVPRRRAAGGFSVVIPDDPRADHLVILAGPAVELAGPGFALDRDAAGRTRQIFRMRLAGD